MGSTFKIDSDLSICAIITKTRIHVWMSDLPCIQVKGVNKSLKYDQWIPRDGMQITQKQFLTFNEIVSKFVQKLIVIFIINTGDNYECKYDVLLAQNSENTK